MRLTPAQKKKLLQEQLLNKIKGQSRSSSLKTSNNKTTERSSLKRNQVNNQNEQVNKIAKVINAGNYS